MTTQEICFLQQQVILLKEYLIQSFLISVAVKIEVLGYDHIPDKLNALEEFVNTSTVIPLDELLINQTIIFRRKYKKVKLGDSIIAAKAILHGLILVTRNVVDFRNVKGLKIINPWDKI